jgi:hypothetical protein
VESLGGETDTRVASVPLNGDALELVEAGNIDVGGGTNVGSIGVGDIGVDSSDGTGVDGTGVDGTGVDGTGVDGTGVDGTGVDGTGVDGTGVDGTGVDGTGVDGTGVTFGEVSAVIWFNWVADSGISIGILLAPARGPFRLKVVIAKVVTTISEIAMIVMAIEL